MSLAQPCLQNAASSEATNGTQCGTQYGTQNGTQYNATPSDDPIASDPIASSKYDPIASGKYAAVNAAQLIKSVQVTVCGATFRYLPTNKGTFALETATHDQLAATK